jgi:small subunit ribosomal protein S2
VIPGNDDAMRAIVLYAAAIADAVLEGKSSVPQVAVGEDEFVELDEEGNPRRKSGGRPTRARPAAAVRKKTPVRRRPSIAPPAVAVAAPGVADEAAIEAELDDTPETPPEAPSTMGLKRRGSTGTARRPRNAGA